MVAFPSGRYEFISGQLDGVGPIEGCSLFSPMNEFDAMSEVRLVAKEALRQLFEAPESATDDGDSDTAETFSRSRRRLLSLDVRGDASPAAARRGP